MTQENNNGRALFVRLFSGRDILRIASITLAYFAARFLASLCPDSTRVLIAICPAGGIGLAALLLTRRRLWPAILAALFLAGNAADLSSGRPFVAGVGFATANVLESFACAWLITRWSGKDVRFTRVTEVLALIGAATCVNACTALIGAGTAALAAGAPFWEFWLTWWVADGLGILLVAPWIVTWVQFPESWRAGARWGRALEAAVFMAIWCAAAWLLGRATWNTVLLEEAPYMLVPLLIWAILRFGPRGVAMALVALAIIVASSAAISAGPSPWGGESPTERLLMVQLYLAVAVVAGMLLAASHAETKSAERSARENEARIRALGDNLPNGTVYQVVREHDGHMRFLHVGAGIERLIGLSVEDVLQDSSSLYRLFLEEDRAIIAAAKETSARHMSVFKVDARLRRTDGQLRWFHISSLPRRLADGRILWDGVVLDITERKGAEEALRQSEERLLLASQAAGFGTYTYDFDSNAGDWSPELKALWGLGANDPVSLDADRLHVSLHAEDRSAILAAMTAANDPRGNGRLEMDYRVVRPDGSIRWLRLSGRTEFAGEGERRRPWRAAGAVVDITEHKQGEEALERQRVELQAVYDSAPILMCLLDGERNVLFGNRAFEEFAGKSEAELKGDRACGVFGCLNALEDPRGCGYGSDCESCSLRLALDDTFRTGIEHRSIERSLTLRRDNHERNVTLLGATTRLPGTGEPRLLLCLQDITARKRAEDALRESEERLRFITERIEEVFWMADVKTERTFYISPGYERVWGRSCGSLYAAPQSFIDAIHVEDRERIRAALSSKKTAGEPFIHEFRVVRPDGTFRWILDRGFPVHDAGQEVTRYVGVAEDITERKRTEEALQESEQTARALLNVPTLQLIMVDRDGIILDCNDPIAKFFGRSRGELIGTCAWPLMLPDVAQQRKTVLDGVLTSKKPLHYVEENHGRSIDTVVYPILDAYKNVQKVTIIVRDITEERDNQKRLLAFQEQLRSLASELSLAEERERRRIAVFLHDQVAQALVVLRLKFGQLEQDAGSPDFPARIKEIRDMIEQVIEDTYSLTFDLSPPVLYELGLLPAIEWLGEKVCESNGLEFELVDDGQPKPLNDDVRGALFQAIRELLVNVVKHAHATHVKVTLQRHDDFFRVMVEDDGIGFTEAAEPERSVKEHGFGLFAVRERVCHLGGMLVIESRESKGARVMLYAPLARV